MLRTIAQFAYIVPIMGMLFMLLYLVGGEDIIFYRRKKYEIDPKSDENLLKALEKYSRTRDCKILGRTTLEFDGYTYTYDAIMVSYFGTIAFAAEPYAGDIYGELNEDQWLAIFQGDRKRILNPLTAMNGTAKLFRDIYRAEGVKKYGQTETMAVFTNKDSNVAVARNAAACHVSNLAARLSEGKYITDNGTNIEEMVAALAKYTK